MFTQIRMLVVVAVVTLGLVLVGTAAAFHDGAVADCGNIGTFTVRATPNSAGFESPSPHSVLVFEEGGTLSALEVYFNGQLLWDHADIGRMRNNVEEVTCSVTLPNGYQFVITGVYTGR